MSNIVTFIEDKINQFGSWVKTLFNHAETLYETLTIAEKQAANWAYGVIAIINNNLHDLSPVLSIIAEKYPTLSPDVLQGFLDTLIKDANMVVDDTPLTLEDAIAAIAKYLHGLNGDFWSGLSQTLGNLLAILFSPGTPVQKFIGVAEYVYQAIVKPHVTA